MPWPQVPLEGLAPLTRYFILDLAEDVHAASVILLLLLIPAHVGAALKHHFWDRHDVLRGMLPEIPDWEDRRASRTRKPPAPQLPKESEAG
jgi:cytochrome b561